MKILILGAQRSGTNIAAKILSEDYSLKNISERNIGYTSCALAHAELDDLLDWINKHDNFVIQAPSLNAFVHRLNDWIKGDFTVKWIRRAPDEIRKSRKRVGWFGEDKEFAKFRKEHPELTRNCSDSVDCAFMVLLKYSQLVEIIDYENFSDSKFWKRDREHLRIGET